MGQVKNRSQIDFSKMEPLVLGKEPEWVEEQRRADIERRVQFKASPWTAAKEETKALINLYNKGHCHNTIAGYIPIG